MNMIVLGIETSCDETAVAMVNDSGEILSHKIFSQIDIHKKFGGVVPDIAARAHCDKILPLVKECVSDLNIIDAYAATCGPGLIGGLLVGSSFAKTLAIVRQKPFIAVNHLEAHILTPRLTNHVEFPYLAILLSGGHSQIVLCKGIGEYTLIGTTKDDALGECFDKCAKAIGLSYPGGPAMEKLCATKQSFTRVPLPAPKIGLTDFSFSGLKTAFQRIAMQYDKADLAFSFHETICDILCDRIHNVITIMGNQFQHIVIVGGVASNIFIRQRLGDFIHSQKKEMVVPPIELCTDNGVMIAWTGIEYMLNKKSHDYCFPVKPRWNI